MRASRALAGLMGILATGACSASSSSGATSSCAQNPLVCAAGETCAVKDCTCPASVASCSAAACTTFNLACLESNAVATIGSTCEDDLGKATCGDGQWCVQEMNVNGGVGTCSALCDPTTDVACPEGYSCVAVGVGLVASAPVIHVCQLSVSDAGLPVVTTETTPDASVDGAPGDGGSVDAPTLVPVVRN